MEELSIGEIASATGMRVEAIRYYERRGLIPPARRRESGYRAFPASTVPRIRFIQRAKELGFSLDEIADLLSLRVDPAATCREVKERTQDKIRDVRTKIASLRRIESALGRLAEQCQGDAGPTSECPILDTLEVEAGSL